MKLWSVADRVARHRKRQLMIDAGAGGEVTPGTAGDRRSGRTRHHGRIRPRRPPESARPLAPNRHRTSVRPVVRHPRPRRTTARYGATRGWTVRRDAGGNTAGIGSEPSPCSAWALRHASDFGPHRARLCRPPGPESPPGGGQAIAVPRRVLAVPPPVHNATVDEPVESAGQQIARDQSPNRRGRRAPQLPTMLMLSAIGIGLSF